MNIMEEKPSEMVLLVDDEPNVLSGYTRQLRKRLNIETAPGGEEALELFRQGESFAVIVSDMKMPKISGIDLLNQVKVFSPTTIRMMLTGYADINNAMEAVNKGNVFRFLLKPCEPEVLYSSIMDGIRQYRLQNAEKELLEKTLTGSIKILTEILALLHPEAFGRSVRVARLAVQIGEQMDFPNIWSLETAAHLSQIGLLMLPPESVEKLFRNEKLAGEEKQLFDMHPFITADLLKNIPRMASVTDIISYQEKRFDGGGIPINTIVGNEIPLGSRILKAALDYDQMTSSGYSPEKALLEMDDRKGWYDQAVLDSIAIVTKIRDTWRSLEVTLRQLKEGMILSRNVTMLNGRMLVPAGQTISNLMIRRLYNFHKHHGVKQPIFIER